MLVLLNQRPNHFPEVPAVWKQLPFPGHVATHIDFCYVSKEEGGLAVELATKHICHQSRYRILKLNFFFRSQKWKRRLAFLRTQLQQKVELLLVVTILPPDLHPHKSYHLDTKLSTVPLELVLPNRTEQCPVLGTSIELVFDKWAFLSPKHRHPHIGEDPHTKRHISNRVSG